MSVAGKPILWSFRRCPYAMRARMGLHAAGIEAEHREILLRDKPERFIEASPKATVPVLELPEEHVLEHSLDILLWALERNDPQDWLRRDEPNARHEMLSLIDRAEKEFKPHLDRYKYTTRYPDAVTQDEREAAMVFLRELDGRLQEGGYLFGGRLSLADIAIFPFVRQFANTDRGWFDQQDIQALQNWLETCIDMPMFDAIMQKHPLWAEPETAPA